jgi:hypothetical protein
MVVTLVTQFGDCEGYLSWPAASIQRFRIYGYDFSPLQPLLNFPQFFNVLLYSIQLNLSQAGQYAGLIAFSDPAFDLASFSRASAAL